MVQIDLIIMVFAQTDFDPEIVMVALEEGGDTERMLILPGNLDFRPPEELTSASTR
jgi:hypothetical protein